MRKTHHGVRACHDACAESEHSSAVLPGKLEIRDISKSGFGIFDALRVRGAAVGAISALFGALTLLSVGCGGDDATIGLMDDGGTSGQDGDAASSGNDGGTDGADPDGNGGGDDGGDDGSTQGDTGPCSGPPTVTFVAPASDATITVKTTDASTYQSTFKAKVKFCASMQKVVFDYEGPVGAVLEQHHEFTTFADPFVQDVGVGGSETSLASHNGGTATSSWNFVVSATDADNQTTTKKLPFTLVVQKK
jgi:hypothetical protein